MKPATGPVRATTGQGAQGENGAGRRLDVDDLFGMAELTGDAPLSALDADAASIAAKAADSAPPSGANELELEIDVPPAPKAEAALAETPLPPLDPPVPAPRSGGAELPVPPTAKVPLESLGSPAPADSSGAASGLELDDHAPKPHDTGPRPEPARRPITRPQPVKAKEPEIAPARTVASSALTGLLGAALAVIVVIASALSDDRGAGWLGFGPTSDVIATGVVSGFYDTAGGKPVFYVRGRVQNRSSKVRGPVRVTAELVGDGDPEVKAETIAGAEPTPEDVWSLRSAADADKLTRTLQSERVDRKLQPGASLPFFAVIPDPPADLQGRRLQVRVETVEAWTPRAANAAREK